MSVTLRFAPSPTGQIHIGNARTALYNWLFAKKTGGRFILRFDDTDVARSTRAFADQIEQDLAWLGIIPDRIERQSERVDAHDRAANLLREKGLLYPCYETPEELGAATQDKAFTPAATRLWPRSPEIERRRSYEARSRGQKATLAFSSSEFR